MDPVTAVGLLASIIQIAGLVKGVGTRVVSFTKQTSDALGYLQAFENHANTIMLASETIKEHIEQSSQEFERIKPLVSQLLPTVLSHCRSVHEILSKYMPGDGDSTFKSVALAFRSFAKDHRLRDLMTSMNADATQLSMVLSCLGLKRNNKTEVSASWSHLHGRTIWTVPNRLVSHFVGQEDLLSRIAKALQPDEKAEPIQRIAVLQGMGGQGKTQLALRYCGLAKAATRYSGTFWIDSSNETSTRQSFEALADVLKSEEQSFQDADGRINYVKCLLAEWPEQWLMVFDNYDNPMDFKNLRDYMPTGNSGSILVTSRSAHTRRFTSDDTQFLEVDGMAEDDAVNLLYKSSRVTRDDTNIEYAKDIARRLGYLPLAIDQAGAYLLASDNSITFQHFLSHYEANQREILESTPAVWDYLHTGTLPGQEETTKSVFTTWELSMRLLQEQPHIGPAKSQMLTLLAYFDEADISEELFSSYHNGVVHHGGIPDWLSIFHERGSWSSVQFGKVMSEMKALSLVYSTTPPTKSSDEFWHVSLHPLVRDWALLRQCEETVAINSATSSAILAATFLGHWGTADDSNIFWDEVNDPNMECGWFSSTATLSLPFKAHARAWEERLAAAEMTHLGLFERRDPCENVASEIVLLKFQRESFSVYGMYPSICERLWRYCATHDKVLHWIKYQLGLFWIDCLVGRGLSEESIDFCREFVELWRGRQSATARKINYEACATLRLAERLLMLKTIRSVSEAETLLEQLEKDHGLLDPRTSYLARAILLMLSELLIYRGHQECFAKAASLRAIFAGIGKDGWTTEDRRRRLSMSQWLQVLRLDDFDNQIQLQNEWVAMAQERYGGADLRTRRAWMGLAKALYTWGNTEAFVDIHQRLLSEIRHTYPLNKKVLSWCLLELGEGMCDLERHGEGQKYLLESIEVTAQVVDGFQAPVCLDALACLSICHLECGQLDQARSLWDFMCKAGQGLLGFHGGLPQFADRAIRLSLVEETRPVAARIMDAGIYIFIEMTRHRQSRAQFNPEEDGSHIFEGYDVFVFDDAVLIWDEVGQWSGCELLLSRLILIAQLGSFAPYADLLDSALSEFARKKTTLVQSLAREIIRYVSTLATWIRDDAALRGRYSTWACETAREMFGEDDDLTKRCVETLENIKTWRTKTPSWIEKLSLRHFRKRLRNGEN